jgi:magnesium chelatase family protein
LSNGTHRKNKRLSEPLRDRIDLHIEVPTVKFREISSTQPGETSAQIRERVIAARKLQHARFAGKPKVTRHHGMWQHCHRSISF